MRYHFGPVIDMTPAGDILPRSTTGLSWSARIAIGATLVAVLAGFVAAAALFLWIASLLLPVALVAGAVAYAAFRLQSGRGRSIAPLR
jgi:predicted branched-subunit amino acid permease